MTSSSTPPHRYQNLDAALNAFRKQAWSEAYSQLAAADCETPLEPEYLMQLAQAALLLGKDTEGIDALARAHQGFLQKGEVRPAVRCAFWLGFIALLNKEGA